jgi:predicted Rossmann fold nucleotide-binding protein DprA/Smf involved in DNA uptake
MRLRDYLSTRPIAERHELANLLTLACGRMVYTVELIGRDAARTQIRTAVQQGAAAVTAARRLLESHPAAEWQTPAATSRRDDPELVTSWAAYVATLAPDAADALQASMTHAKEQIEWLAAAVLADEEVDLVRMRLAMLGGALTAMQRWL